VNDDYVRPLAELIVRFGANVQHGQILAVRSEPGKEQLARAVAEAAYEHGAKFVDLSVFDVYLKRARALHAAPETLAFVPPWYGEQILALGEHRCARVALSGPVAPRAMEGIDPVLVGMDRLPSVAESSKVLGDRTTNWTIAPCPTAGWAELVHPGLEPAAALDRLWSEIVHVCRLDEPDPVQAWKLRMDRLAEVASKLDALRLDELHLEGPGTSLKVGLLPSGRWVSGRLTTVDGILHAPNIPTEEIFTTPDPERVEGTVSATKPLFVGGTTIEDLRVRFERGRAVEIDASSNPGTLRALTERDEGAARLGEVALVDRHGRVGPLGTVFYDTLLDENAASHIAIGHGLMFALDSEQDVARMNTSEIHVDFMIGSEEVDVSGRTRDGRELPLLRGGEWQV
jgi:aminopeptidase